MMADLTKKNIEKWINGDASFLSEYINEYSNYYNISILSKIILCKDTNEILAFINNKTLFCNGDYNSNYNYFTEDLQNIGYSTFSFSCLTRFYNEGASLQSIKKVIQSIIDGKIKILDWTSDQHISGTEKKVPNEKGFTWNGTTWHRSATFLFYDTIKNFTILLGQDEGTYFGCQLNKNVKSINAAFNSLVPSSAKNYVARQGEWYIVPVNKKQIPKIDNFNCIETCQAHLPRENDESNVHTIEGGEIRIKGDIIYASEFSLHHDQHDAIFLESNDDWYTFRKNTAIRSFSQEGVD